MIVLKYHISKQDILKRETDCVLEQYALVLVSTILNPQ